MQNHLSNSSLKLFLIFLNKQRGKTTFYTMLCIMAGAIPSIDGILLKKITDVIESIPDKEAGSLMSVMMVWIITYALWWEVLNVFWRVYDYVFLKALPVIKGTIIEELYDYTQHHYHKFFQENLAGTISNRITEGARSFEMIFVALNEKIARKLSVIAFALITMYSVHHIFAFIFLCWLVVFIGISLCFTNHINNYTHKYASNKALLAGKIVDSISNISAVRIFTSHRFERKYLASYVGQTVESEQKMQWFMLKLRYVLGLSCSIMMFLILYYLCVLRSSLTISVGDCILILVLCLAVVDDIWDLTQEVGDMFEEIGIFNQSLSLVEPYVLKDMPNAKQIAVSKGEIEFKNVTFYFKEHCIFANKSITIKGRQKIGLVGFSGSGKTTFANLIIRLYDITKGEILIDGQNIQNVTQDSLRSNISFIPQEPLLFHRSIMENIRYGKKEASDEEVMQAAKLAHAHDFIMDLAQRYDTLCGERGNNLSGGQRQRIIIARAILKNAPILILDEATSALDSSTESLIQYSLNYLMQNKTVLVIAHRLSTILNMDRIIVFDKGNIEGDDTHQALLQTSKIYKKLWKSQVKGLIGDGHARDAK